MRDNADNGDRNKKPWSNEKGESNPRSNARGAHGNKSSDRPRKAGGYKDNAGEKREGGYSRDGGGYNRDRNNDRSDRPQRSGGYDRKDRAPREGGFKRDGGYNRDRSNDRGPREGGYNRDRNNDRSDRPQRSGGYDRNDRAPREGGYKRDGGGYNRDRGNDRNDRPQRSGGYERSDRAPREGGYKRDGGGYNRDRSNDRNDRPQRSGGYDRNDRAPREGGYKRDGGYNRDRSNDRGPREGGYNRDRSNERSDRPQRSGGYDRSDRTPREGGYKRDGGYNRDRSNDRGPREGGYNRDRSNDRSDRPQRSGAYDRNDRAPREGGYKRDGGGYNRDRNNDRNDRPQRSGGYDRSDRPRRDGGGDRPNRPGRPSRGGVEREFTDAERLEHSLRPVREHHDDPQLPANIEASDLHPGARNELKTLDKENAEIVAKHLAMVARLIDSDPELANQHAISAMRKAGRIPVTRETYAITSYVLGDFATALRELRTYRRLSGSELQLALMLDCERGLGRPERALETARSVDVKRLPVDQQVQVAIALSGARLDLGQPLQALYELEIEQLNPNQAYSWSPELFAAYSTVLEELGRFDEANTWKKRALIAEEAINEHNDDGSVEVYELEDEEETDVLE